MMSPFFGGVVDSIHSNNKNLPPPVFATFVLLNMYTPYE